MQPLVQFESQLLAILSDIDAPFSPFASPDTGTAQLAGASPLTERALRYQRREASRTGRSTVASAPLLSPTDSTDPLFPAQTHSQYDLISTPVPPRELLDFPILGQISSLGPEPYRSTPTHSHLRKSFEHCTPATFPRLAQAPHKAEQHSFPAGFRCPPRAPPLSARSRASRSMSSSSTTSPTSKTATKGLRPSVFGTASPRLAAQPGRPQETSSPVASSALRAISGSGTDRSHGLRPDAPVSPRAPLGGPRGPPAHFGCLTQIWDSMEPALRARIGSIPLQDAEASLALARAAADVDDTARTAADACALSMAEDEYVLVMQPLQARAVSLDAAHADLSGRLRHLETQRRSTAVEMATAERHHRSLTPNIGAGSRQPPSARSATRPVAPAASVTFFAPTTPQWRHTAAPAPLQHQAPAASTGSTAPPAAPAAGSVMPPPPPPAARVPFTTTAPWSVVAARRPRQPPPSPRDDRYLDLRLSKLMFVNKFFPVDTRKPIKELASHAEAVFRTLNIKKYHLRSAVQMATQDGTLLCDYLVDGILRLPDLLDTAYATPAGAGWVREALSQAAASCRPARTTSSGSDTSSSAGPRRHDEPSSGRGNSKRAILTETSDIDDRQPRHQGRHPPDRQATACIYHATDDDSDAPPFPPRVFRYRNRSRRPHPRVATPRTDSTAPVTNDLPSLQHIVEAATAAAIAAVDHHLAHLGLTPRPETALLRDTVHHRRSHAIPRPETASLHDTVHHHRSHAIPQPEIASLRDTVHHRRSHAIPRPETASLHDTVHHHRSNATPRPETASLHDIVHHHCSYAIPAPIAPPPPLTGLVAPTTEPSAISTHASCPPVGSAAVEMPPQVADPSGATPTHNGYPLASLTPLVPTPAPLQPAAPTANPTILIAPAPSGPLTHSPPDERILYDDSSSQTWSNSSPLGLRADFVANMQAAYRTLDMRHVPRIQPLQFPPPADRTADTQLLIRSMRDALSGIFDVADPTGTVTMDSPVWVSGWHAPLLKLNKAAINANRDDTHDLHRLVDDLFLQTQERLSSGSGGPAAFRILLTYVTEYFDRAPRGAALETLQKFGVRTGTPFSSYLRALHVVVASTVEKGSPLAPSATMAIELVRIRTAQQHPTLMPTLFPGDRATREKSYALLALMWTAFADLKHNISPAINGDAFASAPKVSSLHALPTITAPTASVTVPHCHNSRPSRLLHTVSNISPVHSSRDPFRIDYGIWPLNDQDYAIVCTVTNHALHIKLSLWTPFSLRAPAVRHVYSIAAAAATVVLWITAFDGARRPSPIYYPFSTRNSPRTMLTAPYSRHGNRK